MRKLLFAAAILGIAMYLAGHIPAAVNDQTTLQHYVDTHDTTTDNWVADGVGAVGNKAAGALQHYVHCDSGSNTDRWRELEITAEQEYGNAYPAGSPCPPVGPAHKLLASSG